MRAPAPAGCPPPPRRPPPPPPPLTPSQLYTWNTKTVFAYAVVEYEHGLFGKQQHFVWDSHRYTIRGVAGPGLNQVNGARGAFQPFVRGRITEPLYAVTDHLQTLRGKEFELVVGWTVMPYVGRVKYGEARFDGTEGGGERFRFPDTFVRPGVGEGAA